MKAALDTNVLAYAEGVNGDMLRDRSLAIMRRLQAENTIIPAQTLGELYNVLTRKAGRSRAVAREAILQWSAGFAVVPTSADAMLSASDLASSHNLNIWDAVILAAASLARARLLLSEDMQSGFTWGGVTVVNPFAASPHPLLQAAFTQP